MGEVLLMKITRRVDREQHAMETRPTQKIQKYPQGISGFLGVISVGHQLLGKSTVRNVVIRGSTLLPCMELSNLSW